MCVCVCVCVYVCVCGTFFRLVFVLEFRFLSAWKFLASYSLFNQPHTTRTC